MWCIIIKDAMIGALLLGGVSFITELYGNYKNYYKVLAFLWAVPLTFAFFIYLCSRKGKTAIYDFSLHAVLGSLLTVFIASVTLFNINQSYTNIQIINISLSVLFICVYFTFKIYELF
jgi:hypothetical protein